jgi:hypothetical protein
MPRSAFVCLLLSALSVVGCPRKNVADQASSKECHKYGEACLFAPGKGGVCVERTTCPAGERCFTCQSQH